MVNVYNLSEVIYVYSCSADKSILVGNRDELIKFLARNYKYINDWIVPVAEADRKTGRSHWSNCYIDSFTCNWNELSSIKNYIFYDGYDRIINPLNFDTEAFEYFSNVMKHKEYYRYTWQGDFARKYKNKAFRPGYNYKFRSGPVPFVHCCKGGPFNKGIRKHGTLRMCADTEYGIYMRKAAGDFPYWTECRERHNEKNWKSQRKRQYKGVSKSWKNIDKVFGISDNDIEEFDKIAG